MTADASPDADAFSTASGSGSGERRGYAGAMPPRDDAIIRDLERLERLTFWLDDRFTLPGTSFRFGLDPIFGLIPGVGDSATAALTAYMILIARKHGLPAGLQARLAGNLALDWLIGGVPLVGDLFDFAFKANRRNLTLLRRYLEDLGRPL